MSIALLGFPWDVSSSHARGPLIGADIVELNPERDIHQMTAHVAARFIKELSAKLIS